MVPMRNKNKLSLNTPYLELCLRGTNCNMQMYRKSYCTTPGGIGIVGGGSGDISISKTLKFKVNVSNFYVMGKELFCNTMSTGHVSKPPLVRSSAFWGFLLDDFSSI